VKEKHWFLPDSPDLLGMLRTQAAITVEAMDALVAWSGGDAAAAVTVRDCEHRADETKRELWMALRDAYSPPLDAEVAQAEAIIESRVRDFEEWIKARRVVPVIQDLRTRADALRRRELERALKQLARGEAPEVVVELLSQALTNKFLHDPMSTLREAGDNAEQQRLQALLARFYSNSDD